MSRCQFKAILTFSLLLAAILGAQTSPAAPLCHEVLTASHVNPEAVDMAVKGLAELRLALDLKQVHGVPDLITKSMELDYEHKVQELAKSLQLSDVEVRKKVRAHIPQLQKVIEKKSEDIVRVRESEKNLLPIFHLKENITGLNPDFSTKHVPRWIELLEDKSRLVFEQNYQLITLDIKTNKFMVLVEDVSSSVISKDAKFVYVVSKTGMFETYSTDTLKLLSSVELKTTIKDFEPHFIWSTMAMNPSGDRVAIAYDMVQALIFNTKTGKMVANLTPDEGRDRGINFAFTSDRELILASSGVLAKYDLSTKKLKKNMSLDSWSAIRMHVNSSGSEMVVTMSPKSRALGTKTFFLRTQDFSVVSEVDGHTYLHVPVPDSKKDLTLVRTEKNALGIYEGSNLDKRVFDFQDHYKENINTPHAVQVSRDGSSIFVFYMQSDINLKTIEGIDVWKRNPDKEF